MTGEEFLKNMDLIDPALVEAAAVQPPKKNWISFSAITAVAAIIIAVLLLWKPNQGSTVMVGEMERRYKTLPMAQAETEPIYPWEYLTEIERYTCMTLNSTQYRTRARTLDRSLLGESIGTCIIQSYDIYTEKEFTMEKTAFTIKGISPSELVAVELGGEFCVFLKDKYSPPADFGAFWDSVDLPNNVNFDTFIHFSSGNETDQQRSFRLINDEILLCLLKDCSSAPYLELERFYDPGIETVSFSITSEKLGVYKHGFQISSDGYLSTNLMEWGYVFQIGEDAASRIIQQVKQNSVPAAQEPYFYYLYGTFTGIEDGYLLVDDTILCIDKKDGMVFRIPMDDIRISRDFDLGYIAVGDVVLVSFTGTVDAANGNIVTDPVSIQRGTLEDGEILIEE